ncbi:MAG TPA: hypothetical protein VMM58_00480 [Bacteroidota bacterium]|nr:hypothetical protein [Bacteroidota bacterium]
MNELIDIAPKVDVRESEFMRLLGYPPDVVVGQNVKDLMDSTASWYARNGRPWVYARRVERIDLPAGKVRIDGREFSSQRLYSQLTEAHADSAMVVAVSAGESCETRARELWEEEKPDEYFFMEVYGSAVVEHLVTHTGARFCEWADHNGAAILPHYSPGYPGWDITEQSALLNLIFPKKGNGYPGQIRVLDTGMLQPKKSLLAVFGITHDVEKVRHLTSLVPCENCSYQPCQYRRMPYKRSLPQLEDVRNLQPTTENIQMANEKIKSPLEINAKYLVSTRALEKWSKERLTLDVKEDRSVEARFRYEGTTCSDLGHAIEFEYRVKLSPADEHYKILEASSYPAAGDVGHTLMCEYLENGPSLMRAIRNEKPLLGRLLNEVLTWKREFNPSGCYCSSESRDYKWGLVLEVIHYALVQMEKRK